MIFRSHKFNKNLSLTFTVIVSIFASALALALDSAEIQTDNFSAWSEEFEIQAQRSFEPRMKEIIRPLRWVRNDNRSFRSKSEVMNEVKRRYNAKVLRISLNEKRAVYNIRVLLPSGRVKNVQISARR